MVPLYQHNQSWGRMERKEGGPSWGAELPGAPGQQLGSSVPSGRDNMSLEKPTAVFCVRRDTDRVLTGTSSGRLSLWPQIHTEVRSRGDRCGDSRGEAPLGAKRPGEHDYLQLFFRVLPQSLLKASGSVPQRLALEGQRVYLVLQGMTRSPA